MRAALGAPAAPARKAAACHARKSPYSPPPAPSACRRASARAAGILTAARLPSASAQARTSRALRLAASPPSRTSCHVTRTAENALSSGMTTGELPARSRSSTPSLKDEAAECTWSSAAMASTRKAAAPTPRLPSCATTPSAIPTLPASNAEAGWHSSGACGARR
eukprot:4690165-Pleurochrysis_carterae.AAC.2